jgi:hypothetical protein
MESHSPQEPHIEEVIQKGLQEKSQEEDKALKEKAVTYTPYDDFKDFPDDHLAKSDFEKFIGD